ncbi:ABC transporter substrate-binding protein [uncultured Alistipes sp.]|jgi:iron complex transport system substrate-binding protein|uniref:ABC transporter substrate-binding protein n=1 Tax=uncultured Alistipes sp. TaxID=538949 RepID=UPI0025F56FAD|nr:ABC transporter substrate-binding protein [uncultured Alistipes sp.]
MKTFLYHLYSAFFTAVIVLLVACNLGSTISLEDFDMPVYTPSYASGFEVVGAEGRQSTILRVFNPWQGAENTQTTLFIARNGEKAPAEFAGQVVEAGARRIVCLSSTYVAMLDALAQADRVVGVSGRNYISNQYVTTHPEAVADIGFDGNIDYEVLLAQQPDLVLLFGVSGASGMESKLLEMGIPFCYIGEYLEESPLGKAEWLVAVAEITDSREKGEAVFGPIPERYDALRAKVAAATSKNPNVMINTPYAGSWFMASTESYVARLIADAGGDYIYKKNTSNRSLPIDLEEAYLLTSAADIWLNAGSASSLGELKAQYPKFAATRCVRSGAVYNCNKRMNPAGGNDYWESGVAQPDVVLHDLIAIMRPEVLAADDRELYYYQRLE